MLTDFCVYTIVSRDRLDPVALEGIPLVGRESRIWRAGDALREEAQKSGQSLPILLADAKDCSRLLYWGLLQEIELRPDHTKYTVDRLRALPGRHTPQELVLRSTGEHIAQGFIRPYALCHTPRFLNIDAEAPALSPEEGPSEGSLVEGAAMQVTVNAYERNPEARRRCIAHYGCRCFVCGFDFAARYGDLGEGFIEVHHLVPLFEIQTEYKVDPIRDLRPLCPNCHAMIHRERPPLDPEELRRRLVVAA